MQKAIDDFLAKAGLSELTIKMYDRALRAFSRWFEAEHERPPAPQDVAWAAEQWKASLVKAKLKAATVNAYLSALTSFGNFHGINVDVPRVRQQPPPVEALDAGETRALERQLRQAEGWRNLRDVAMFYLMAKAGMRISEVVGLDLRDLQVRERSGTALVRHGKGQKERQVPLGINVRKALRAYLKVRPAGEDEAVFLSKSGRRMTARNVQFIVSRAGRRAGISKRVTPHLLRHTFASDFLRAGGSLPALRDILGHDSLATTSRYVHSTARERQAMVDNL